VSDYQFDIDLYEPNGNPGAAGQWSAMLTPFPDLRLKCTGYVTVHADPYGGYIGKWGILRSGGSWDWAPDHLKVENWSDGTGTFGLSFDQGYDNTYGEWATSHGWAEDIQYQFYIRAYWDGPTTFHMTVEWVDPITGEQPASGPPPRSQVVFIG
jgi:hypothetical protein